MPQKEGYVYLVFRVNIPHYLIIFIYERRLTLRVCYLLRILYILEKLCTPDRHLLLEIFHHVIDLVHLQTLSPQSLQMFFLASDLDAYQGWGGGGEGTAVKGRA